MNAGPAQMLDVSLAEIYTVLLYTSHTQESKRQTSAVKNVHAVLIHEVW